MRKIEQFLPPVYRTPMTKNFMASTTNQLFSQKDSENSTFFVGRKVGGLYNNSADFYADEIRKIREDYQLEPTFIIRDNTTDEVANSLFYEDVLNALASNGSDTMNHNKLFNSKMLSYSPPIDVDMFINYRNYYWYPEGVVPIALESTYSDIVGGIYTTVFTRDTLEPIELTNGMFVIPKDKDDTYIVDGVGDIITLLETPYIQSNRVVYSVNNDEADPLLKYPMEYVTMDRGCEDKNTWSRQNAWYHRDAISHTFGEGFTVDNSRRASRPIICFTKDLELFNYPRNFKGFMDNIYSDHQEAKEGEIYILLNSPTVFEATDDPFRPNSLYDISESDRLFSRTEPFVNSDITYNYTEDRWVRTQTKAIPTQNILFNLFDEDGIAINDELKYPNSNFTGNGIFCYMEDQERGIYDSVLGKWVVYFTDTTSSEMRFENCLNHEYKFDGGSINNNFYKVHNRYNNDRIIRFTIQSDNNNGTTIYANDERLPNILVYADTPYLLDFSDLSTTSDGWFRRYRPVTIEDVTDKTPVTMISATHAYSRVNRHSVKFKSEHRYRYSDGDLFGNIIVIDRPENNFLLLNEWVDNGYDRVQIYQSSVVESEAEQIELKYCPNYTDITVFNNGIEQTPDSIHYNGRTIAIDGIKKDDYIELYYYSNEDRVNSSDVIQLPHPSLSNNPYNENVTDFSFSMVFAHMQSIIRNQQYLEGTPLSNNRYRDTLKDYTLGNIILKHDTNFPLLQFVLQDNDINPILALRYISQEYEAFKQNIIVGIEHAMRDNDIVGRNVNKFVDNILFEINGLKLQSNPFAHSNMLAAYNSYVNIVLDDENRHDGILDVEDVNNAVYVYNKDGIKLVDLDFSFTVDYDQGYTTFSFNFEVDDTLEIRYFENMSSTFVPPTPTKFGLSRPYAPRLIVDDSYIRDTLFIRGHDGSSTPAFTSMEDYNDGYIDPRDLALLDVESRIYNGIELKFRNAASAIVDFREYRPGKFRPSNTSTELFKRVEFSEFHKWTHENFLNYRTNESYIPDDPFTYNYRGSKDQDGEQLSGHWKSIYTYYYDTYRPHIMPWEMLGFDVKPLWWDSEYGEDYSSLNKKLWSDLEYGIIRQGIRKNTENSRYLLSSNIYRREGLSNYIPVDHKGMLIDPITIGITNEPDYVKVMNEWEFGDYGAVEQAWRCTSTYVFMMQIFMYVLDPLRYISRAWNTDITIDASVNETMQINAHSSINYVSGVSQWIYDYLASRQLDTTTKLITNYTNQDIVLGHKVGGYVDSDEIRVFTESYNPRSTTNTTLVPIEDVSVSMYESKELSRESYSGILIERVTDPFEVKPFNEGTIYIAGDIVIDLVTKLKYKFLGNIDLYEWMNATYYLKGRTVSFNNIAYTCKQPHRATNQKNPFNEAFWEKKKFVDKEWEMLDDSENNHRTTHFKIIGYDIYDPFFTTIAHDKHSGNKKFVALTRDSKATRIAKWESGIPYKRNDMFVLPNKSVIKMRNDGITTNIPEEGSFDISDATMAFTNTISQNVFDKKLTDNGTGLPIIKRVEYGRIFKTVNDVCQFIKDYSNYLEHKGWVFDVVDKKRGKISNWDLMIEDFMQWSYEAREKGSVIMLSPAATNIKFKCNHGVPSVKRGKDNGLVVLLNHKFREINEDGVDVLRIDDVFSLKSEEPVYYCSIGVKEYEHAIYIKNRTVFGDYNFFPLYNMRKDRFQIRTTKTTNWNGKLAANGYIVVDGNILPNFDTSVDEIRYNADMESVSTNSIINKLKYHNIGFRERSYFSELEMDIKSQVSFYKGFIKDKGTMNVIDRFLRNTELGNETSIDVYEEWAIREGDFGGLPNSQFIEFVINSDEFKTNPQPLYLEYKETFRDKSGSNLYYNLEDTARWVKRPTNLSKYDTIWDMYSEEDLEAGMLAKDSPVSTSIINAGHVRWDDVDFRVFSLQYITEVLEEFGNAPAIGDNMWVSRSIKNNNNWDVYQLEETNIVIDEILTVGKDDKCSFIIKTRSNVNKNGIYGIYDDKHLLSFELLHIEDNYYLGKPFNCEETNVLDNDVTTTNISIYQWVSCRICSDDIISEASSRGLIMRDNTRLYSCNDNSWVVYRMQNGNLSVDRRSSKKVRTSLIDSVLMYDQKTHDIISRFRVYDPLKGLFPTTSIKYIDWITQYDPACYDSGQGYTRWGKERVGMLWWDTSQVAYIDYETGSNEYRTQLWGAMFPKSKIVVNEWVESVEPPPFISCCVKTPYVVEKTYDKRLGIETKKYYYWVENNKTAPSNSERIKSANEIANDIRDGHLVDGYVAPISDNALIVRTDPRTSQYDTVLQINYRINSKSTPTYTQWRLIGETESNSDIPESLHNKMIDSLLGYDINGNRIPAGLDDLRAVNIERVGVLRNQVYSNDKMVANLEYSGAFHESLNSIYGNGKYQSWFVNQREAKRIFAERINAFLSTINWWDIELFWQRKYDLPTNGKFYGFVPWYSDDFNRDSNEIITSVVKSRDALRTMNVPVGSLIRVNESVGRMPPVYKESWTIYRYLGDNTYKKVGQDRSTLQLNKDFVDTVFTLEEVNELRKVLDTIYELIFVEPYRTEINNIFFALIRYVFTEQESNDWVFPTSYISLTQTSKELIQKPLYQQDREHQIRQYIEEAKPYRSKLRKFEKVHTAPIEELNMHVTDFDKMPYITVDKQVINLQEDLIDKIRADGKTRVFDTTHIHNQESATVYVNGRFVPKDRYSFSGIRQITFEVAPPKGINSPENIIVISNNNNHRPILRDFKLARGYNGVYTQTMSVWLDTVNQKDIFVNYDRISIEPNVRLETLKQLYDESLLAEKPREAFTNLSRVKNKNRFTQSDRTAVVLFYDQLADVVSKSTLHVYGESDSYKNENLAVDNVLVFIDDMIVPPIYYTVDAIDVGIEVKFVLDMKSHGDIFIRPKKEYHRFIDSLKSVEGLGSPMKQITEWKPTSFKPNADLDDDNKIKTDLFIYDEESTNTVYGGKFNDPSERGVPEEYFAMRAKETVFFTSMNNFNLVPKHYVTVKGADIFEAVRMEAENNTTEIPINLNVDPEQVFVYVDGDIWVNGRHYTLEKDKVVLHRRLRRGQQVVIADKVAAFDMYYDKVIDRLKNINIGGFDGNIVLPDNLNDKDDFREFIVMSNGKNHVFSEISSSTVTRDIKHNDMEIQMARTLDHIAFNSEFPTLIAIHAIEEACVDGQYKVKSSFTEFVMATGITDDYKLVISDRGVFDGQPKNFDLNKYKVTAYYLSIDQSLSATIIPEPYIGNRKNHYPKYGHIVTGNDNGEC